jgi:hypothetical protein
MPSGDGGPSIAGSNDTGTEGTLEEEEGRGELDLLPLSDAVEFFRRLNIVIAGAVECQRENCNVGGIMRKNLCRLAGDGGLEIDCWIKLTARLRHIDTCSL